MSTPSSNILKPRTVVSFNIEAVDVSPRGTHLDYGEIIIRMRMVCQVRFLDGNDPQNTSMTEALALCKHEQYQEALNLTGHCVSSFQPSITRCL